MSLKAILTAMLMTVPYSVAAAPTASCLGLIRAYTDLQKNDESMPRLFKEVDGHLQHSDRVMITGVRDNVGSFLCSENDNLDQLELDYNGAFLEDEQQKNFALLRFEKVAIALIRAFAGDNADAENAYKKVMLPAVLHAHNAVVRGDEEPAGETAIAMGDGYELKMKINREGPTLYLQHPDFDKPR